MVLRVLAVLLCLLLLGWQWRRVVKEGAVAALIASPLLMELA